MTQKRRVPSDHPRSRGVYLTMMWMWSPPFGSSPLARGLLDVIVFDEAQIRIIPARAGFTGPVPCTTAEDQDHPRSRGVYPGWPPGRSPAIGSSPLARGLPQTPGPITLTWRIIPARAGFTLPHDRLRQRHRGSSPLARGLPRAWCWPWGRRGIIPARAGFTLADPWNPNEPVLYQTPAAFTADPGPAPPSCGSAVVVPRWTTTPSGA